MTPILLRGVNRRAYGGDRCVTRAHTRAFLLIRPHKLRAWTRVLGEVAVGTGTLLTEWSDMRGTRDMQGTYRQEPCEGIRRK